MISYEVSLGLVVLSVVLCANSKFKKLGPVKGRFGFCLCFLISLFFISS